MFYNTKSFDDFYFISNVCTGDYVNSALNIPKFSPMNATTSDDLDFMYLIDHYRDIDFDITKSKVISYNDVKAIQRGYTWNMANKKINVDSNKTFALEYPYINNKHKTQQLYYRHYEYNAKNLEKIQRRIDRYHTTQRIPFFIFHYGNNMVNVTSYNHRCEVAKIFANTKNQNKLFISKDPICLKYVSITQKIFSQKIHEELLPEIFKKLKESYGFT